MSDLYKSAIADAKLLREAAIKSVESVILEKYSGEIKQAVDEVLSSDELYEADDKKDDEELFGANADGSPTEDLPNPDNLGSLTDTADVGTDLSMNADDQEDGTEGSLDAIAGNGGDASAPAEEDDSFPDMPEASMNGESVDGAVQSDQEIEIDLSELEAMANSQPSKVRDMSGETQSHESILPDMASGDKDEPLDEPLMESEEDVEKAPKKDEDGRELIIDDELLESLMETLGEFDDEPSNTQLVERRSADDDYDDSDERARKEEEREERRQNWADEQHDKDRDAPEPDELDESIKFDYEPVPSGKVNQPFGGGLTGGELRDENARLAAAKAMLDSKDKQESAMLVEINKKVGKLAKRLNALEQENGVLKGQLKETGNKLLESTKINAKLHYANRALRDGSLNEHQKNKLVESLGKTKSAEEAKAIYDTAMELIHEASSFRKASLGNKRAPSLQEVLAGRNRSLTMTGNRSNEREDDAVPQHMKESWQRIAGIKNNKQGE